MEQAFNSLHAQREACEAYALSQRHEGWELVSTPYDDGGFSGGNIERPALQQLIQDLEAGIIDIVLVYKVDRLSRSLADFVRLIERFDQLNVSFVSVTQQFNTSSSMGRLTLNVLLSFAQFEREVTSERIRDKIAASKKKGQWMGGTVPLGFDAQEKQLIVNDSEAMLVNHIYQRYLALGCVRRLKNELDVEGKVSKSRKTATGNRPGKPFSRGALYQILKNPLYLGKVSHKGTLYEGQHQGIVELEVWEQVQAQLQKNGHRKRTRTQHQDPSLLAGMIEDDAGNPMSPTHTKKGNRRYRYYISQAMLQFKEKQAGSLVRVAAKNIEKLVVDQLLGKLADAHHLLDFIGTTELAADQQASLIQAAQTFVKNWPNMGIGQQIGWLQAFIKRVTVGKTQVSLEVHIDLLRERLLAGDDSPPIKQTKTTDNTHHIQLIQIPVQFQRSGIETKLVVSKGEQPSAHQAMVKAMQADLLKALKWNKMLMAGEVKTLVELGKQEQINARYLKVLLQLAYLAPDIMTAIAKGQILPSFTVRALKKGLPLDWQAQRQLFFKNHR